MTRRGFLSLAAAPLLLRPDLTEPAELASAIRSGHAPKIICVAFPVLYRQRHIQGALFAGATRDGVEALGKLVAGWSKEEPVVLYCGCCPMDRCPNVRPALAEMKRLGFTHVRVLNIPRNFHTDWVSKGYPVD